MAMWIHRGKEQLVRTCFLLVVLFTMFSFAVQAQTSQEKLETKADTLMSREDYEGAVKLYSQILSKDEGAYNALYKRAVCYYSLSRFDEALKDINTFIAQYPSVPQAKLLRTYLYRELGDEDAQLKSLAEVTALEPFNTDLLKWHASLLIGKDKYKEARNKLLEAKSYHDDSELEMYLGLTYYYLDQADSALQFFDQSIALDNNFISSYVYAGSLCLEQSAYDMALSYLNKGLSIEHNNLTLIFYKGIALTELNKVEEGCHCLSKAFYGGIDDAASYLEEYCYKR